MQPRYILGLIRKWIWLIILACLVGGIAGLAVSLLQPKTYEADTTVYLVSPNRSDFNTVSGDQQAAVAFARIPQSNSVLTATLQAVGDKNLSTSQLSSMLTISNTLNSQFVDIKVRDRDPKLAARLSTEVARQSIAQFMAATSGGQAKQFVKQEMDNLAIQIKNLENELANAQSQTGPDANTDSQSTLITQLSTNLSGEQTLYNQLLNTYMSMDSTQAVILQQAQVPQKPVEVGQGPAIAIGMLVGLVVIIGVIFFIEQNDDILRTPTKVKQASGLSTFITVKRQETLAKQPLALYDDLEVSDDLSNHHRYPVVVRQTTALDNHYEVKVTEDTDTAKRVAILAKQVPVRLADLEPREKGSNGFQLAEEFITLGVLLSGERNRLASNGSTIKSLLVTSPENGDGKTLIASQIALGLAKIGVEVVLIDANLRNPEVHKLFGLSNRIGLSSLLTTNEIDDIEGEVTRKLNDPGKKLVNAPFAALQEIGEPNMTVLLSGHTVTSPPKILVSPRMDDILNRLGEKAFVVVDGPAVLTSSDAVILANKCDSILMVVNARHTSSTSLNQSLEILAQVNTKILGAVLNQANYQS